MSASEGASWSALLAAEGTKLARQPTARVLALVLASYLVLMLVAFASILGAPEVQGFDKDAFLAPLREDALAFNAALFASTGTIVAIVLGASSVGHELSRGTLRAMLLAGAPRARFGAAKLASLALASVPVALVGIAFAVGATLAFGAVVGERLLHASPRDVAWLALGLTVTIAGWAVLAGALTLASGSLGVGIGVTIGVLIAGDVVTGLLAGVGDLGVYASRALPNAALGAFLRPSPPRAIDWVWILANLGFWIGALPALAVRRLRGIDALAATRA